MAELFEEDEVTPQHGSTEPEDDESPRIQFEGKTSPLPSALLNVVRISASKQQGP